MPFSAKTWNRNSCDHSVAKTDKCLYSNNTGLLQIQQRSVCSFEKQVEGEKQGGNRRGRRSDLLVAQPKQRRFPGLSLEKFNPCMFVY